MLSTVFKEMLLHLPPVTIPLMIFILFLQKKRLYLIIIFVILFSIWSYLDSLFYHNLATLPLNNTKISHLPPYLHEESTHWCNDEVKVTKQQRVHDDLETKLGYALVTGASRGIGRAIAIELARHGFPLILTSRTESSLTQLATLIRMCYDVDVKIFPSDLSIPGEVEKLHKSIMIDDDIAAHIDVLILNAGIGPTSDITSLSPAFIQKVIQLNSVSVAEMSSIFGADMKQRRRGRIVIVSSVISKALAVPGASIYSATKVFNRNLAYGLVKEMEEFGVGVTCVLPGATSTDFATNDKGGMSSNAMVWKYPFVVSTPEYVAKQTVSGMLHGTVEVVPGFLNYISFFILHMFLPMRFDLWFMKFSWHPWPYGNWLSLNENINITEKEL